MNALDGIEGLSECIGRAIQEHLAKSNINLTWPQIDRLDHPVLRFEAFIEDAGSVSAAVLRPEKVASVCSFLVPAEEINTKLCNARMRHNYREMCITPARHPGLWWRQRHSAEVGSENEAGSMGCVCVNGSV